MLTGSFTFMSGLMNEDESLEFPRASVLATVFAAITAVVQLAAMILAAYYLEQTISQRSEEIDAIEDDKEVAALEAGEVEFNNCYDKVTQWAAVPRLAKATLYLSFVTMVVCCYLVQLFSNACFAEYQLTFTIDEHLDGDWLNFILPLGWVAIFLFLFSCILLGCFITWASVSLNIGCCLVCCLVFDYSFFAILSKQFILLYLLDESQTGRKRYHGH